MSEYGSATRAARSISTPGSAFGSIPISAATVSPKSSPSDGTRLNLIFNGAARANNVLLDEPVKWPGYTHGAFLVEFAPGVLDWAAREGVAITEGPVDWGRRLTCFVRDPDGNVLEFNELRRE